MVGHQEEVGRSQCHLVSMDTKDRDSRVPCMPQSPRVLRVLIASSQPPRTVRAAPLPRTRATSRTVTTWVQRRQVRRHGLRGAPRSSVVVLVGQRPKVSRCVTALLIKGPVSYKNPCGAMPGVEWSHASSGLHRCGHVEALEKSETSFSVYAKAPVTVWLDCPTDSA